MRALIISLLAVSVAAAPALAQEAPVATAPAQSSASQVAPPLVVAPPATQDAGAPSAGEATDPLADLIAQSGPQTTDEEEPAAQTALPPHKPTVLPIPAPEPPEDEIPGHAVPQGSYLPVAEAYDLRIKGSIVAAQGLQGPFDGGWSIVGPDGSPLYALQIVDKVGGYDGLEGAWRDTRRVGAVGSTGLIDFVERSYNGFQARFSPRPGQLATLDLTPRGDGTWSGKLVENGTQTPVIARRVAQATLPAGYVPAGRGPVIWGAPRVAPRVVAAAPERAPACSTKGKKGKALKAAKAKCATAARKGGKAKGSAVKGKKGGKGKAVTSKKGAKGKATAKGSSKKKRK